MKTKKDALTELRLLEARLYRKANGMDELEKGIELIDSAVKHMPGLDPYILGKLKDDLKLLEKHQKELQDHVLDKIIPIH